MIHLVSMPFGSITNPALALGLFKSQCAEAGIPTEVHHFNFSFARRIGLGAYGMISLFKGVETQVGEWLFAREAWRRDFGLAEEEFTRLCGDELGGIPHVEDPAAWLRLVRNEVVPQFLDDAVDEIARNGPPEVVAFSCTFFQTIASLALGRRLRERFPSVRLVYGGACFHGEMGRELFRAVDWLDAVSVGEADDVIIPLLSALRDQRPPKDLHGILYRDRATGNTFSGPEHTPATAELLEQLPVPNYDPFFRDARRAGLLGDTQWLKRVLLPFESARGCWWGQKQHCTFCGLNGEGMAYRSKSPERVYDTLVALHRRYPAIKRFQAADNILDMRYFHDLLPRLAEEPVGEDVEIFWSVKANMRADQIRTMAEAGVRYVQPGIESLSDNMLRRMRKGVSALQNVFFMKACLEEGIVVYWNNLIRMPGETAEDYQRMTAWLPQLVHLRPAFGGAPKVECHRFSPYFFEPGRYVENRRPMAWYAGLYPEDTVDLERVAYYFDADWNDVLGGDAYDQLRAENARWTDIWREEDVLPQCVQQPHADGTLGILDTRFGEPITHRLDPSQAEIYAHIHAPRSAKRVFKQLEGRMTLSAITAVLDEFVALRIALQSGSTYVSLALLPTAPELPIALRMRGLRRLTNQGPAAAVCQPA